MLSEVTVILRSEDSVLKEKVTCYEDILIIEPIKALIEEAKKKLKIVPDEIQLRISVEWV